MKKRFLILTLLVAVCITATSCNFSLKGEQDLGESETSQTDSSTESVSESTESAAQTGSGTLGDYTVTIKEITITTDKNGKDTAVVTFDFTNNGSEEESFGFALAAMAFQNGEQLDNASMADDTQETQLKKIQKGETTEARMAYLLLDKTTPVEIEVKNMSTLGEGEKVTKTFTIG